MRHLKYLLLIALIWPGLAFGGWMQLPGPVVQTVSSPSFVYDYCVRADGTATKVAATDCTDAAESMSMTTFNASSFSAGDIIAFSGRGGEITTGLVPPSSGTLGNEIIYIGESGNLPVIGPIAGACLLLSVNNVVISDMTLDGGLYGLHVSTGSYTGIETNNLVITNPGSEGARHEGTVDIIHNGISISGVAEPITTHSLSGGNITILDSNITGYDVNGAIRGAPGAIANWVIRDSTFTAAAGGLFVSSTLGSLGTYTLSGNTITDAGTTRGWDLRGAGVLTMENNIITGGTTGDFYILPASGSKIYNNTFRNFDPSTCVIFNNAITIDIKNNIFHTVPNALYGSTGTIANNAFYASGTAYGTNTVTTDPALDANGKLTASSTAMFAAGIGPSSDANVPTVDIDGDTRSGTTTDLGADQY